MNFRVPKVTFLHQKCAGKSGNLFSQENLTLSFRESDAILVLEKAMN
jgi:hypothetical protein